MFARTVLVEAITEAAVRPVPLAHIDSFAMRNFTNDALFDDTLPLADGRLEIGNRIPLDRLQQSMEDWLRRKNYLAKEERLRITEP
jgi:hypothetical protein